MWRCYHGDWRRYELNSGNWYCSSIEENLFFFFKKVQTDFEENLFNSIIFQIKL
jgi:hypothetical protein